MVVTALLGRAKQMKLERLSLNKIKYSIELDELTKRGFLYHDLWKEAFIWDELFDEMFEEAKARYNLHINGTVAIEIYSFTTEELTLIVTLDEHDLEKEEADKIKKSNIQRIFSFVHLEDLLQLAYTLRHLNAIPDCTLFLFDDHYFLIWQQDYSVSDQVASMIGEEYGQQSSISPYMLKEYGTTIFKEQALMSLLHYFQP